MEILGEGFASLPSSTLRLCWQQ